MGPETVSINLVFTSAGRRVELLRAFKAAYLALGLDGNIVALDVDPLAPALQVADRAHIVPRLSSPDYVPKLRDIIEQERGTVVFPLIDPDIPVLAKHRALLEKTGARLAAAPLEDIGIAADKWLTFAFFEGLGFRPPASWTSVEAIPEAARTFPLFVKPRFGSAGHNTFKAMNLDELTFFARYVPDPIVQEYLPGPEITTDVICDLDGEVISVVSRRRIEVRWGEVAKGVTVRIPEITDACVRIAEAFHARGPITVQCMMKEGIPRFTEINARLGGGAPLGIAAGADWPRWLLARIAGKAVEIPPLGSYREGLYMTRFDDSFFLTHEEYEKVAGSHIRP